MKKKDIKREYGGNQYRNTSEEDKQKNKRISTVITQKNNFTFLYSMVWKMSLKKLTFGDVKFENMR